MKARVVLALLLCVGLFTTAATAENAAAEGCVREDGKPCGIEADTVMWQTPQLKSNGCDNPPCGTNSIITVPHGGVKTPEPKKPEPKPEAKKLVEATVAPTPTPTPTPTIQAPATAAACAPTACAPPAACPPVPQGCAQPQQLPPPPPEPKLPPIDPKVDIQLPEYKGPKRDFAEERRKHALEEKHKDKESKSRKAAHRANVLSKQAGKEVRDIVNAIKSIKADLQAHRAHMAVKGVNDKVEDLSRGVEDAHKDGLEGTRAATALSGQTKLVKDEVEHVKREIGTLEVAHTAMAKAMAAHSRNQLQSKGQLAELLRNQIDALKNAKKRLYKAKLKQAKLIEAMKIAKKASDKQLMELRLKNNEELRKYDLTRVTKRAQRKRHRERRKKRHHQSHLLNVQKDARDAYAWKESHKKKAEREELDAKMELLKLKKQEKERKRQRMSKHKLRQQLRKAKQERRTKDKAAQAKSRAAKLKQLAAFERKTKGDLAEKAKQWRLKALKAKQVAQQSHNAAVAKAQAEIDAMAAKLKHKHALGKAKLADQAKKAYKKVVEEAKEKDEKTRQLVKEGKEKRNAWRLQDGKEAVSEMKEKAEYQRKEQAKDRAHRARIRAAAAKNAAHNKAMIKRAKAHQAKLEARYRKEMAEQEKQDQEALTLAKARWAGMSAKQAETEKRALLMKLKAKRAVMAAAHQQRLTSLRNKARVVEVGQKRRQAVRMAELKANAVRLQSQHNTDLAKMKVKAEIAAIQRKEQERDMREKQKAALAALKAKVEADQRAEAILAHAKAKGAKAQKDLQKRLDNAIAQAAAKYSLAKAAEQDNKSGATFTPEQISQQQKKLADLKKSLDATVQRVKAEVMSEMSRLAVESSAATQQTVDHARKEGDDSLKAAQQKAAAKISKIHKAAVEKLKALHEQNTQTQQRLSLIQKMAQASAKDAKTAAEHKLQLAKLRSKEDGIKQQMKAQAAELAAKVRAAGGTLQSQEQQLIADKEKLQAALAKARKASATRMSQEREAKDSIRARTAAQTNALKALGKQEVAQAQAALKRAQKQYRRSLRALKSSVKNDLQIYIRRLRNKRLTEAQTKAETRTRLLSQVQNTLDSTERQKLTREGLETLHRLRRHKEWLVTRHKELYQQYHTQAMANYKEKVVALRKTFKTAVHAAKKEISDARVRAMKAMAQASGQGDRRLAELKAELAERQKIEGDNIDAQKKAMRLLMRARLSVIRKQERAADKKLVAKCLPFKMMSSRLRRHVRKLRRKIRGLKAQSHRAQYSSALLGKTGTPPDLQQSISSTQAKLAKVKRSMAYASRRYWRCGDALLHGHLRQHCGSHIIKQAQRLTGYTARLWKRCLARGNTEGWCKKALSYRLNRRGVRFSHQCLRMAARYGAAGLSKALSSLQPKCRQATQVMFSSIHSRYQRCLAKRERRKGRCAYKAMSTHKTLSQDMRKTCAKELMAGVVENTPVSYTAGQKVPPPPRPGAGNKTDTASNTTSTGKKEAVVPSAGNKTAVVSTKQEAATCAGLQGLLKTYQTALGKATQNTTKARLQNVLKHLQSAYDRCVNKAKVAAAKEEGGKQATVPAPAPKKPAVVATNASSHLDEDGDLKAVDLKCEQHHAAFQAHKSSVEKLQAFKSNTPQLTTARRSTYKAWLQCRNAERARVEKLGQCSKHEVSYKRLAIRVRKDRAALDAAVRSGDIRPSEYRRRRAKLQADVKSRYSEYAAWLGCQKAVGVKADCSTARAAWRSANNKYHLSVRADRDHKRKLVKQNNLLRMEHRLWQLCRQHQEPEIRRVRCKQIRRKYDAASAAVKSARAWMTQHQKRLSAAENKQEYVAKTAELHSLVSQRYKLYSQWTNCQMKKAELEHRTLMGLSQQAGSSADSGPEAKNGSKGGKTSKPQDKPMPKGCHAARKEFTKRLLDLVSHCQQSGGVSACVRAVRPRTRKWRKAVKKQCDVLRAKIADRRRYHRRWRYLTHLGRRIVRLRRKLRAYLRRYRKTRSRRLLSRIRRLRRWIQALTRRHRRTQYHHRAHALRLIKEQIKVLQKRIRTNWRRYQKIRNSKGRLARRERRRLWRAIKRDRRRAKRLSKQHNTLMWRHIGRKAMLRRIRKYLIRLRRKIRRMQRTLDRISRRGSHRARRALLRRLRYLRWRFRQMLRYYKHKRRVTKPKRAVKEINAAVARKVPLERTPMPKRCGRRYFQLAKRIIVAFNDKWGRRSKSFTRWIHRTRTRAQRLRAMAARYRGRLVTQVRRRSQYIRRLSRCLRSRLKAKKWRKRAKAAAVRVRAITHKLKALKKKLGASFLQIGEQGPTRQDVMSSELDKHAAWISRHKGRKDVKLVARAASLNKRARHLVATYMHAQRIYKRANNKFKRCRPRYPQLRVLNDVLLQVGTSRRKKRKGKLLVTIQEALANGYLNKPLWLQPTRMQAALRCDWKCQSLSSRVRLASHLFNKLLKYMDKATRTLQTAYDKARRRVFAVLKELRRKMKCRSRVLERFHAGAMPAKLAGARDAALAICRQTSSRAASARRRYHRYQNHKMRQYKRRVHFLKRWHRRTRGRFVRAYNARLRLAHRRFRSAIKAAHMRTTRKLKRLRKRCRRVTNAAMSGRSALKATSKCGRRRQKAFFTLRVLNQRFRAAARAHRRTNYRTLKRMYQRAGAYRKFLNKHWDRMTVKGQLRGQRTYDRMTTAAKMFVHKMWVVQKNARRKFRRLYARWQRRSERPCGNERFSYAYRRRMRARRQHRRAERNRDRSVRRQLRAAHRAAQRRRWTKRLARQVAKRRALRARVAAAAKRLAARRKRRKQRARKCSQARTSFRVQKHETAAKCRRIKGSARRACWRKRRLTLRRTWRALRKTCRGRSPSLLQLDERHTTEYFRGPPLAVTNPRRACTLARAAHKKLLEGHYQRCQEEVSRNAKSTAQCNQETDALKQRLKLREHGACELYRRILRCNAVKRGFHVRVRKEAEGCRYVRSQGDDSKEQAEYRSCLDTLKTKTQHWKTHVHAVCRRASSRKQRCESSLQAHAIRVRMAMLHCHHLKGQGLLMCLKHVKAQTASWRNAYQRVCPFIHDDATGDLPSAHMEAGAGPASKDKAQCSDMVHRHKRWFDMENAKCHNSTTAPAQNATVTPAQRQCLDALAQNNQKWWAEYKAQCQAKSTAPVQEAASASASASPQQGMSAHTTTQQTVTSSGLQSVHTAAGTGKQVAASQDVTQRTVSHKGPTAAAGLSPFTRKVDVDESHGAAIKSMSDGVSWEDMQPPAGPEPEPKVPLLSVTGLRRLHQMCQAAIHRKKSVVSQAAESCGESKSCLALVQQIGASLHAHATQVCHRSHVALMHARVTARASLHSLQQGSMDLCKRAKKRFASIKSLSTKACMGDAQCQSHVAAVTRKYWSSAAARACKHAAAMKHLKVPGLVGKSKQATSKAKAAPKQQSTSKPVQHAATNSTASSSDGGKQTVLDALAVRPAGCQGALVKHHKRMTETKAHCGRDENCLKRVSVMDQSFLRAYMKYCPTCAAIHKKIKASTEAALRQCYQRGAKTSAPVKRCRDEVHAQFQNKMEEYHRRCPSACARAKSTFHKLMEEEGRKCQALPSGSTQQDECTNALKLKELKWKATVEADCEGSKPAQAASPVESKAAPAPRGTQQQS